MTHTLSRTRRGLTCTTCGEYFPTEAAAEETPCDAQAAAEHADDADADAEHQHSRKHTTKTRKPPHTAHEKD